MKLGSIQLDERIQNPTKTKEDVKGFLKTQKGLWANEKDVIKMIKMSTMPKIDISFLQMSQETNLKWFSRLPLFACYHYDGTTAFGSCEIRLYHSGEMNVYSDYERNKTIENHLVQACQVSSYPKEGHRTEARSQFVGLLPSRTKKRAKEADRIGSVYLVAEANWQEQEVTIDPIIISMVGNIAFLIDHFDTTKVENYVLSEFLI